MRRWNATHAGRRCTTVLARFRVYVEHLEIAGAILVREKQRVDHRSLTLKLQELLQKGDPIRWPDMLVTDAELAAGRAECMRAYPHAYKKVSADL